MTFDKYKSKRRRSKSRSKSKKSRRSRNNARRLRGSSIWGRTRSSAARGSDRAAGRGGGPSMDESRSEALDFYSPNDPVRRGGNDARLAQPPPGRQACTRTFLITLALVCIAAAIAYYFFYSKFSFAAISRLSRQRAVSVGDTGGVSGYGHGHGHGHGHNGHSGDAGSNGHNGAGGSDAHNGPGGGATIGAAPPP